LGQRTLDHRHTSPIRTDIDHRTDTSSHVEPPFFVNPPQDGRENHSPTGQDSKSRRWSHVPRPYTELATPKPTKGKRSYPLGKLSPIGWACPWAGGEAGRGGRRPVSCGVTCPR
jgi:hypothetical protein